jgi:F-box associated region
LRPIIEFSICIAARWDCGSTCRIELAFSDDHHWRCERRFPQWNESKWHRLIYRYSEYAQFPTFVHVRVTGSDTQFWAGFYGIKLAQARICLLHRSNENEVNTETEIVIEPQLDEPIEPSQLYPIPDIHVENDD